MNTNKMIKNGIFQILILLIANLATAQSDDIDFSSMAGINNAIDSGKLTFDQAIISEKVSNLVRAGLLGEKYKTGISMDPDSRITFFENGKVKTMLVENFNLNSYNNFKGQIKINGDGSITITSSGGSDEKKSIVVGQNNVVLPAGSSTTIKGKDKIGLPSGSGIEYKGTIIENRGNSEFDVVFNQEKPQDNYVSFYDPRREVNVNADGAVVELTRQSQHDIISRLSGNNIRIKNGGMVFVFENSRLEQKFPFSDSDRSMVINDVPNKDSYFVASPAVNTKDVAMNFMPSQSGLVRFTPFGKDNDQVYFTNGKIMLPDGRVLEGTMTELATSFDGKVSEAVKESYGDVLKRIEALDVPQSQKDEMYQSVEYLASQAGAKIKGLDGKERGVGYSTTFVTEDGLIMVVPALGEVPKQGKPRKLILEGQRLFPIPKSLAEFIIGTSTKEMIKIKESEVSKKQP